MNVNDGRGSVILTLLGLLYYLFAGLFIIAFCIFALGIGALALLMAGTWHALQRRRARKRELLAGRPAAPCLECGLHDPHDPHDQPPPL